MTESVSTRARMTLDVRLFLAVIGCLAALAAGLAVLFLLAQEPGSGASVADILRDPELRRDLLARIAEQGSGEYDSHPDPAVARVMLRGTKKRDFGTVSINAYGMREREYALPKPAGTTRVVLLGDSFVFGMKGPQDVRLGVHLERFLSERCKSPSGPIEVLHLGIPSWNFASECAYLRRQLHQLQPDLVLHVTCSNDLDDVPGIRGFGSLATFAPEHAERADSMAYQNYPELVLGFQDSNYICNGFEHESRSRFEAARQAVLGLIEDLGRAGTRYLMVGHWYEANPILHAQLGRHLDAEHLLYVPGEISNDEALAIPGDGHWNAAGHERMARLLFGTIRSRSLLPELELEAWPEVEEEARRLAGAGWKEAQDKIEEYKYDPRIEPRAFDDRTARQVLSGLDREGLVSPYSALVLGRPKWAKTVHVTGRFLPDRVLEGTEVHVFAEEFELGAFAIRPGEALDVSLPLPGEVQRRKNLSVRFVSDDYVYRGSDLRHCVVFELERVALE